MVRMIDPPLLDETLMGTNKFRPYKIVSDPNKYL